MKLKKLALFGITGLLAFSLGFVVHPYDNYFEISKNMDIFGKLYREINAVYVDEPNPSQLMKVGIVSMLEKLDPYTNFISESQIEDYKVMSTGQYSGIGATIDKRGDKLIISDIDQKGSSVEGGLKIGDEILQIDNEVLGNTVLGVDEINNLLRGEQNSTVSLTIKRINSTDPLILQIPRKHIRTKNVPYYGMASDDIGYIILGGFTQDAGKEVAEATASLKKEHPGLKGIILDLRGNPGGRLDESVNVTNVFIPRNELVVETRGRMEGATRQYATQRGPVDTEIPLAVIVNNMSASASEIVSGTIQDLDRGVIVGRRSYGKGLVQNVRPLSYNTQLKVTIAKYYTPSGRCIQAIDYANRNEDGSVGKIPDSLQTAFKTRNGRTVYDGGGVLPDIVVDKPALQPVTQSLKDKGLIFNYVTIFTTKHEKIASPEEFAITDAIYSDFVKYVSENNFSFKSKTDEKLGELKEAIEVGQYQELNADIKALEKKIAKQKDQDLYKHRAEIQALLEKEIINRYYYKDGLIKASFHADPDVVTAIDILNKPDEYKKILTYHQ